MRYFLLLIPVLFFAACLPCECPPTVQIDQPKLSEERRRSSIVVYIDSNHQVCLNDKIIPPANMDSVIKAAIDSFRITSADTPKLVINADTTTDYGEVFRIMQSAKRAGAKVVANVK